MNKNVTVPDGSSAKPTPISTFGAPVDHANRITVACPRAAQSDGPNSVPAAPHNRGDLSPTTPRARDSSWTLGGAGDQSGAPVAGMEVDPEAGLGAGWVRVPGASAEMPGTGGHGGPHLRALEDGGAPYVLSNLQAACRSCKRIDAEPVCGDAGEAGAGARAQVVTVDLTLGFGLRQIGICEGGPDQVGCSARRGRGSNVTSILVITPSATSHRLAARTVDPLRSSKRNHEST